MKGQHIGSYDFEWRGGIVRVETDGLGPWIWPNTDEQPETWETMVFGGPEGINRMQWRYLSREHAVEGHQQAIDATRRYLDGVDRAVRQLQRLVTMHPRSRETLQYAALLLAREGIGDPGLIPAQDLTYTPANTGGEHVQRSRPGGACGGRAAER